MGWERRRTCRHVLFAGKRLRVVMVCCFWSTCRRRRRPRTHIIWLLHVMLLAGWVRRWCARGHRDRVHSTNKFALLTCTWSRRRPLFASARFDRAWVCVTCSIEHRLCPRMFTITSALRRTAPITLSKQLEARAYIGLITCSQECQVWSTRSIALIWGD